MLKIMIFIEKKGLSRGKTQQLIRTSFVLCSRANRMLSVCDSVICWKKNKKGKKNLCSSTPHNIKEDVTTPSNCQMETAHMANYNRDKRSAQ